CRPVVHPLLTAAHPPEMPAEIGTMQSAFHNLTTFAGVMQSAGEVFGARDVEVEFDEEQARISLDISGAYSPEAQLHSYRRV
ncbi:hypothetical protein ACC687_41000, partial [Rhizobium ruizarguesonis]